VIAGQGDFLDFPAHFAVTQYGNFHGDYNVYYYCV
jgi:hypothetical protein